MIKWIENIWYHYKWFIVAGLIGAFVLAVVVSQCVSRPKYDMSVVVCFTDSVVSNEQFEVIKEDLEKYAEDYNGDGEININFMNCTFDESKQDANYVMSMRQKLQFSVMGESSAILYITDDKSFEYINGVMKEKGDFFLNENLSDYDGKALKINNLPSFSQLKSGSDDMPDNIYISKRVIKGTIIETEPKVNEYELAADKYLESIKQEVIK